MSKTILIAPFDGPLAAALASEATAAGWSVALALPRGRPAADASDASDAGRGSSDGTVPVTITFDPKSYISISSLVLSAVNALGELDAAVLVFDPSAVKADFLGGKPGELTGLVEERCAGPLFLSRELARRFEARKTGSLLLLAPESPRDAAVGPPAAMAEGAFEGLGRGIFSAAVGAPWQAFGLRDSSGQSERAARFALELLGEALSAKQSRAAKAGRWLRYTGKAGIFGQ